MFLFTIKFFLKKFLIFLNLKMFIFSPYFIHLIYPSVPFTKFDGLKIIFTFSCLPIVFYYIVKFVNTKTEIYFYKLILVLSYLTLNSHEIYLLTCFLIFLIF